MEKEFEDVNVGSGSVYGPRQISAGWQSLVPRIADVAITDTISGSFVQRYEIHPLSQVLNAFEDVRAGMMVESPEASVTGCIISMVGYI